MREIFYIKGEYFRISHKNSDKIFCKLYLEAIGKNQYFSEDEDTPPRMYIDCLFVRIKMYHETDPEKKETPYWVLKIYKLNKYEELINKDKEKIEILYNYYGSSALNHTFRFSILS